LKIFLIFRVIRGLLGEFPWDKLFFPYVQVTFKLPIGGNRHFLAEILFRFEVYYQVWEGSIIFRGIFLEDFFLFPFFLLSSVVSLGWGRTIKRALHTGSNGRITPGGIIRQRVREGITCGAPPLLCYIGGQTHSRCIGETTIRWV